VSADAYNTSGRHLVAVIPITTQPKSYPLWILIHPPEGGLSHDSFICCDQVRTVSSRRRFQKHLGRMSPFTMQVVDQYIRVYLDV
jgi:mRNA-degrading endonuclease toxin of MazEF toxin-antitoxin module